ncbi:hypothetical protein TraAM80_10422, partial [Trypanosoma rangeli]
MLSTCVGQQVTAHFGGLRFRSVHACGSGTFCAGSALPRARATQLSKRGAAAPGPQCCRGMVTVLRVARVVYASGCGGHQVRCAAYGGGVVAASGLCRVSFVCRWACRHGGGFRCRVGVLHPEMAGAGRCGRGHTAGFRIFCCAQASATCGRGPFLAVVRASVSIVCLFARLCPRTRVCCCSARQLPAAAPGSCVGAFLTLPLAKPRAALPQCWGSVPRGGGGQWLAVGAFDLLLVDGGIGRALRGAVLRRRGKSVVDFPRNNCSCRGWVAAVEQIGGVPR